MSSFRIEESQLREWHVAASQRTDVRGVAAVAKELEAHLAKKEPDGTVIVSRHQLFTWAEALQGAAARAGDGTLQRAVDDMRATLSGTRPATATAFAAAGPAPAAFQPAPAVAPAMSAPYQPPAAVTYVAAAAATAPARGGSFVAPSDLAPTVRELLRGATTEVRVVAPWTTGVETLVGELTALAPSIRVLIVSRRPEREDTIYHQAMDQLGRRRAITAFSPHIQTRMIVVDHARALVGAASVPLAQVSREAAVLVTDPGSVEAAVAHFDRVFAEAGGTRV